MTKSAFKCGQQLIALYDKINARRMAFNTQVQYSGIDMTPRLKILWGHRNTLDKIAVCFHNKFRGKQYKEFITGFSERR